LCRLDDQPFELVHRLLAVEPDRSGLHDGGPPPHRAKSYGDERLERGPVLRQGALHRGLALAGVILGVVEIWFSVLWWVGIVRLHAH
jgi:hypothetical protein